MSPDIPGDRADVLVSVQMSLMNADISGELGMVLGFFRVSLELDTQNCNNMK